MRYILYCRKSSEEDRRQAQSLETQETSLLQLAASLGLQIAHVFRESKSARFSGNRPQFAAMVEMIKEGKADAILSYAVDRLARNLKDQGELVELMDKSILKEVRTINDLYVTSSDLLKMNINSVFAENYSRALSERVRAGNATKLTKGEYPSAAPIGYLNIPHGIIHDPQRAHHIKDIFELYSSGLSIGQIVKRKYLDGLRSKGGSKLYKSSIERILKNPEYYGVIRRKGQLYKGNHEPIISQALFKQVKQRLEAKSHPKRSSLSFIYRDYLICHECGCKLTATQKKGKYTYYYCTNGKGLCSQHQEYLKESEVFRLIAKSLADLKPNPKLLELSLKRYLLTRQKKADLAKSMIDSVQAQLANVKRQQLKLEEMYLNDRIEPERYDQRIAALRNEKVNLEVALKEKQGQTDQNTLELLPKFKDTVLSLESIFTNGNAEAKAALLKSVLWNCEIADKQVINTRYKDPYNYLLRFKETSDLLKLSAVIDYFRTCL